MKKMPKITVSIVEDDEPVRQILSEWLRASKDFQCISEHGSVEAALTALPKKKPDVVLMDVNLPGFSGIEGVRQLKPQLPKTQFLMLTVYEDSDHIFNALAAGATGYLLKQTPCDELLAALKAIYTGESPMTGSIARKIVQSFQAAPKISPPAKTPANEDQVHLTPREREVLELLARGYLYKEISDTLNMSVPTVNTHIRHIYEKLHVQSRGRAVAKYSQLTSGEKSSGNLAPA
jgi:DNA-binding NarL/FixJ family response regulator